MTAEERLAYKSRVGEWLQTGVLLLRDKTESYECRLQNAIQASMGWNDAESQAFEEGARLLSALVKTADTWLPELLYAKAAGRCIKRMMSILSQAFEETGQQAAAKQLLTEKTAAKAAPAEKTDKKTVSEKPAEKAVDTMAETTADNKAAGTVAAVPPRPKHIDQYVHLLPAKTQERAAKVKDLLRELDYAREKARLLMGSPQASRDDMAAWAKKATACDNAVRSIYKELDAEWDKLVKSGRIEVDVFGNARVTPSPALPEGRENISLTSEQKHRRRELRKWLIDTRRGAEGKAREKRIEQWKVNIREYLSLEPLETALKDEKIVAAAEHFGIDLAATPSQHTAKEPALQEPTTQKHGEQEPTEGQPTEQQ